jgi:hypothetical protein
VYSKHLSSSKEGAVEVFSRLEVILTAKLLSRRCMAELLGCGEEIVKQGQKE